MKVLFIIDGIGRGGLERRMIQTIKGINEAGYKDVYLIHTLNRIEYDDIYECKVNITYINRRKLSIFWKLKETIDRIDPDIIQVWSYISGTYLNIIYPFLNKKPKRVDSFIADCNYNKHTFIHKLLINVSFLFSNIEIGNSEAGLNSYHAPKKKRLCIYNGFNFKRLKLVNNVNLKQDLSIPETNYVVTMIARVDHNKDYNLFIKAANLILKERQDITFLGVGYGNMYDEIKASIPVENGHNILMLGKRDDVENILNITDISVLCTNSLIHGEGISNSILESMAFSTPVIATNGGGTVEIVKDGYNGFLVQSGNETLLKEKILYLINNVSERKKMSINALQTIQTKFSIEKATKSYLNVYKGLLNLD